MNHDVRAAGDRIEELLGTLRSGTAKDTAEELVRLLMALYGEGLGLDSIDILELSLAISKAYGVKLRSDDENNTRIFSSLRSLSQHIQSQRT